MTSVDSVITGRQFSIAYHKFLRLSKLLPHLEGGIHVRFSLMEVWFSNYSDAT